MKQYDRGGAPPSAGVCGRRGRAADIRLSKKAANAADSKYSGAGWWGADAAAAYPRSAGVGVKLGACSVMWLTKPTNV